MPNSPHDVGVSLLLPHSLMTTSERYLLLIVVGMFLVGVIMAAVEMRRWWKRQTVLCIKPPSRMFNLLSSISNFSKRPLERNPPEKVKRSAEGERGRSRSKAA